MNQALGIHIENLYKSFPKRSVIENLNLDIEPGSFISIVGPSGCGKSTLLRLIAGLDIVTKGKLDLFPSLPARSISFVFQEPNLLSWRTVAENVGLPFELLPELKKVSTEEKNALINSALKKVKLDEAISLFPHELSGGMKMRVSLARALVNSPKLLLMDEPFAALDENIRFEMQNQLRELWLKEKITVIFVTHSLYEAAFLSERIIMLKGFGAEKVLDQKLNLPSLRNEDLRTSESFNAIIKELSVRLRK
ncbi:MAG: ABC transporter ATP-binding protein [Pseudobdellovibrionaceae bacterium]